MTPTAAVSLVVVGVDGSADAEAAVAWAAQVAGQLDAGIVAVHAVGLLDYDRTDDGDQRLSAHLGDWTRALDGLPAGRVRRRLVPGPPVDTILAVAAAERADLVVVGTRGTGRRIGVVLGSTSLRLAEGCPCPLVIVPARI